MFLRTGGIERVLSALGFQLYHQSDSAPCKADPRISCLWQPSGKQLCNIAWS